MAERINVNGVITPAEAAVVPVLDHGFLYGDGVYETLRTYGARPSLVERHLKRLANSCRMIRIPQLPARDVERELNRTLESAGNPESAIRIMVTRGIGALSYEKCLGLKPSLVIIALPLRPIPAAYYDRGVSVHMGERRRNPVDSLDPAIKSCNLLNNLLAHLEGQDARAKETILLNTRGYLAEGSRTNVFFVRDGVLKTPALDCGLLEGITRGVVLESARHLGVDFEEGHYTREDLEAAEEIFITSTLQEILPVRQLVDLPVGAGSPGPVTRRLLERFRTFVRQEAAAYSFTPGS